MNEKEMAKFYLKFARAIGWENSSKVLKEKEFNELPEEIKNNLNAISKMKPEKLKNWIEKWKSSEKSED